MTDNIINIADLLQQRRVAAEKPVVLEDYVLPNSSVLMPPQFQLELLSGHAFDSYLDGNLDGIKIHTLLATLGTLYTGIVPPFCLTTKFHVRELPTEKGLMRFSVIGGSVSLDRLPKEGPVEKTPASYEIEIGYSEFDEGMVIDKGTIYPEDRMIFNIPADSGMTARLPRHLIRRMNELVRINGGFGQFIERGYAIVLPYGGKVGMMIALQLEHDIGYPPAE